MRKIVLAIVFFSCLMQQQIIWANDTGVVVVCIEGSQITDSDAIQKSIQQSAGQKAVRKALGRFIAPALEADSIFQTIVAESEKYVIKPVKVLKTEKRSGKKLFFCGADRLCRFGSRVASEDTVKAGISCTSG